MNPQDKKDTQRKYYRKNKKRLDAYRAKHRAKNRAAYAAYYRAYRKKYHIKRTGKYRVIPQSRLTLRYYIDHETGCHIWTGSINDQGYGILARREGTFRAHRVAYERKHGPLADGVALDHTCHRRACVNADHLEPATNATNTQRGLRAKLSWEKVWKIRSMYAKGAISTRALAKRFKVSSVTVFKVVSGQTWKDPKARVRAKSGYTGAKLR